MSERARQLFDAIGAQLVLVEFGGDPPKIGQDYAIEAILGAGGFGLICRATQLALHRRVALKLFPLGGSEDPGVREALREARSLARLEHPGIVGVHAAGESELIAATRLPCAFVELQFVEGQTLRAWLDEAPRELDEVVGVLLEAGRALAHAHDAGVVHRDFKPENVMVDRAGHARVIDFGLALATEQIDAALANWSDAADALGTRATATGLVRGTPGYMAPEASQGLPRAASDQFAFAVVVREALTGKHPFHPGEGHVNAPPGGPEWFARIKPAIDRAMAPTPDDRFASVTELCDAIASARAGARPRTQPRSRKPILALGLLGLVGAGVVAASTLDLDGFRWGREPVAELASPEVPLPEAKPEAPEPITPGSCAELESWAGTWQLGGKVAWTEYAYQLDWWLAYTLELSVDARCRFTVRVSKYRPLDEAEPRSEPLVTEVAALAVHDPSAGSWRLPLQLEFEGDTNTYGKPEREVVELELDRVDGSARIRGGFRRIDSEGNLIRTGILLGAREQTPALASIAALAPTCRARCANECAGEQAERACVERRCVPERPDDPVDPDDVCGPPSVDFVPPLRARIARKALARGESLLEQSLAQGNRTKLLAQCSANARAIAGRWIVDWTDHEARSGRVALELEADGCLLSGNANVGAESIALTGEVSVAGTWMIRPSEPTTWLPSAMVVVGVGPDASALGSDLDEPARQLRAHRRSPSRSQPPR